MIKSIKLFFISIYKKLFIINDTPQRMAIGFGLGVFLGMLPGTGPIASLVLAALFNVNKAAALLGSILTNTWLSIITLVISLKIGAFVIGTDWHVLRSNWQAFLQDFHWKQILELKIIEFILPIALGYIIISFIFGLTVYILSLLILSLRKTATK